MAKSNWISICQQEYKADTELITWESSSEEESLMGSSSNDEYFQRKKAASCELSSRLSPIIASKAQYNDSDNHYSCSFQSPIIKFRSIDINKISPELPQRTILTCQRSQEKSNSPLDPPISPIIQRRRFKRKKLHLITRPEFQDIEVTPDLFLNNTQDIENESPTKNLSSQASDRIEPFQSQFGSPVEHVKNSTECNAFLYFQPPIKRKSYKKGGLGEQLQKLLKLRKSRVKIWHHEKHKNIDSPLDNPENVIKFKFKKRWTEYGVVLIECDVIKKECNEDQTYQTCILNLGVSQILNLEFEKTNLCELYPPYSINTLIYKGKNIPYYYNISKIIKFLNR